MAGNRISTQTGIGTAIAIAGVAMYSLIKANIEEQKRVRFLPTVSLQVFVFSQNYNAILNFSTGALHIFYPPFFRRLLQLRNRDNWIN